MDLLEKLIVSYPDQAYDYNLFAELFNKKLKYACILYVITN